jgi:branched-chain amino acid transport system permease protein
MLNRNTIPLLCFALLILLAPWALPSIYFKLTQIGIYAIICVGLSLLMGYAGQISLGHAAFYAIGAYTSGLCAVKLGWSPYIGTLVAVVLSSVVAFLLGASSLRLHGHYLAMATLAFGEIINVIARAWISLTGGPSGVNNIPRWSIFGHSLQGFGTDKQAFYLVWAVAFIGVVIALRLIDSRVGRALRSIHDGEQAANVLGVNTNAYKVKIFILSAAYASVAGSLFVHVAGYVNTSPFGIEYSILFLIMVIVGGMRSVWGAVLGAVVMGMLPELLSSLENWRYVIYGGILLVILMFVPQGLLLGARDLALWTKGKIHGR